MNILAIDTSCDETAVAVTSGRRVISNVLYSQVLMHKNWGGVVPSLARRAHEERIDLVIDEALKKAKMTMNEIDYIAVTYGPGLAIALEVGITKAQELAKKYNKKIIPVNHMAGHTYSCFVQNSKGKPEKEFEFPYLSLLVSGGHTELVLFEDHMNFKVIGQTRDDAAGEAIDKIGRLVGLGYPAGPAIEKLSKEVSNKDYHNFPRAMLRSHDLDFSFSGLKTAFLYYYKSLNEENRVKNLKELVSSFQEAVFDSLLIKTEKAIQETGVNRLVVGGGVIANMYLRMLLRRLVKKYNGTVLFPPLKYLTGDNAAMIGVAAYYQVQKGKVISADEKLERVPRLKLEAV
jgi:N6-L-threonylcarbamoyladenine synthase